MALNLMYITNKPQIAQIAERAGVNRIFVDMEYIGKAERQGGMDTVQNHHTLEDVKQIARSLSNAELLVRVNPIHDESEKYISSFEEINKVIENGAKILMLPYFKTVEEVKTFLQLVNGRAKTMLLFETSEAVEKIDDILALDGIDEVFIGLNDLSLGYGKKFMFELLSDGTVERLCQKFKLADIPYGFGGIAALGKGKLPAEKIIIEHYRLESSSVILSRSFCDVTKFEDIEEIDRIFMDGIRKIRKYEMKVAVRRDYFEKNKKEVKEIVSQIIA